MDERTLIEYLKNGDEEAFRIVVERYQKLILNCAYKFVRNRETAEDITQEVFVEVFESIHSFRSESQLSSWMYRIAVTKSLNYLKSLKRKKRFAMIISLFGGEAAVEQIHAPGSTNPEKQLENQERAGILHNALGQLPENQKVAFTLSKYQELSYSEIAGIMGTSVPSIESLLHRANNNLKKTLYNYYKHQSD